MTSAESVRPPRRRPWGDARFLLGLLLVAASVAGVWFVVAASRSTSPVLAAAHTIVPGAIVTDADVRIVDVALGQTGAAYFAPADLIAGLVATRTIDEGELVPVAALDDAQSVRTTTVVLRSAVDVPASVAPGTVVEVWQAPVLETGDHDGPRILIADATVVSVMRDESMMGGGSATLEIVIPRADVAAVLAAIADESALSVVPTAGTSR